MSDCEVKNTLEEIFKVKPVGVKHVCDSCVKVEMLPTGRNEWSVSPPLFEHKCNECNFTEFFSEKYPIIRYIQDDN